MLFFINYEAEVGANVAYRALWCSKTPKSELKSELKSVCRLKHLLGVDYYTLRRKLTLTILLCS